MAKRRNQPQSLTENDANRYSFTRDGRLLDLSPMAQDETPLVLDPASGKWTDFDGVFGLIHYSIPVTPEEAARHCKDGTIPSEVRRMIVEDIETPDPEED